MSRILFVCGFATLGFDRYRNLSYLEGVDYFYYANSEQVVDIEARLYDQFVAGNYNILIGHSLGCFMISRLLPKLKTAPKKIILLNPFIENSDSTRLLSYVPYTVSRLAYIPKWLGVLSDGLTFRHRSIWTTDQWKLISFHQICFASRKMDMAAFLETYRSNNVVIIYGECDKCTPISETNIMSLKSATKLITMWAKHEPFMDDSLIQHNLKNILLSELKIANDDQLADISKNQSVKLADVSLEE